ncbi:putative Charged multivesicular body protein 4b [Hypsibius exemplaris]|uniref:Charged multivesicular body protein 4b n=1 Tax=Hypsibius exemplaris TaxID=2072580 RepID=A0A1W0WSA0_HYPEX|nr:putative Charged multivesicular body protein 4b [Hypsibius exemplaris]
MDDDRFRPPFGFPSGFFGSHRGVPRSSGSGPFDEEEDEAEFGSFGEDLFGRFRFGTFGRNGMGGNEMEDLFRGAETMIRHMDRMFRDMSSTGAGSGSFGRIMAPDFDSNTHRRSPRDEMLKVPDSEASTVTVYDPREDDNDTNQTGRGETLLPRDKIDSGPGWFGSWSGSSSSVTTMSDFGDGKSEERRTVQHSDGSRSEIFARRMGNKELTTTIKTDRNGQTEVLENLFNMTEDEKADFEASWKAASPVRDVRTHDNAAGWQNLEPVQQTRSAPLLDPHAPNRSAPAAGSICFYRAGVNRRRRRGRRRMSWFSKALGGGKKKEDPTTPQDAIQRLRETEEMLTKKSDFLENKIQTEIATAKRHGTKNKRAAIAALKRKKRCEKQLQQIDGTLSTIEFQREALENANTNTEVLKIMGVAAKALKSAHQNMDVDQVHDLMDEVAEQQEIANEISEAISNPVGFGHDVDEAELEAELEELEQEELDKQLLDVTPATKDQLPSVPVSEPTAAGSRGRAPARPQAASKHEDDDMKELAEWAS